MTVGALREALAGLDAGLPVWLSRDGTGEHVDALIALEPGAHFAESGHDEIVQVSEQTDWSGPLLINAVLLLRDY